MFLASGHTPSDRFYQRQRHPQPPAANQALHGPPALGCQLPVCQSALAHPALLAAPLPAPLPAPRPAGLAAGLALTARGWALFNAAGASPSSSCRTAGGNLQHRPAGICSHSLPLSSTSSTSRTPRSRSEADVCHVTNGRYQSTFAGALSLRALPHVVSALSRTPRQKQT